jgi:methylphosphotriester-DNA--protein-cysteine methyltransferase
MADRVWRLMDATGKQIASATPGALGGNRRSKVYGQLDCRVAARCLARGSYQKNRVFFADEATALAAGYRPCGVCMRRK